MSFPTNSAQPIPALSHRSNDLWWKNKRSALPQHNFSNKGQAFGANPISSSQPLSILGNLSGSLPAPSAGKTDYDPLRQASSQKNIALFVLREGLEAMVAPADDWSALQRLVGSVNGPADLAQNHDKYLYGNNR